MTPHCNSGENCMSLTKDDDLVACRCWCERCVEARKQEAEAC